MTARVRPPLPHAPRPPLRFRDEPDPGECARGLASMLASAGLATSDITTVLDVNSREPYAWRFEVFTLAGVWRLELSLPYPPAEDEEHGGQA